MLSTVPGGPHGGQMMAAGVPPQMQNMMSAPSPFMAQLGLPPAIMALFAPRAPLPYKKPIEKPKLPPYSGVGAYIALFETELPTDLDPYRPPETKRQRTERLQREKKEHNENENAEKLKLWNPNEDPNIGSDPYKTLFVARVSYKTTAEQLEKEFSVYGPIKQVKLIKDLQGKSRGYAFIEYENKVDMNAAYKFADGKQIGDRCVLVDIEKGRAVKNWRPRRLGGGLGRTGAGGRGMNEPSAKTVAAVTASDIARSRREYSRYERDGGGHSGPAAGSGAGGGGYRDRGDRDRADRQGDRDSFRDRERERDSRDRYATRAVPPPNSYRRDRRDRDRDDRPLREVKKERFDRDYDRRDRDYDRRDREYDRRGDRGDRRDRR